MRIIRLSVAGVACALLIGGCAQTGSMSQSAPSSTAPARAPAAVQTPEAPPDGAPSAFHGLGKLAFVRDIQLWLLNGETDTLRSTGSPAVNPTWSPDGEWLVFGLEGKLMVVEAATAKAQQLSLAEPVNGFAWEPEGHALAVSTTRSIWRVDEPGAPQPERIGPVESPAGELAWSPDGRRIAFVRVLPGAAPQEGNSLLEVMEVATGKVSPWYRADRTWFELAGWWPDSGGILLWVANGWCNSCNADGIPLRSLALGTDKPVDFGVMWSQKGWVAWRPGGREFLMVKGGSRFIPEGKRLALCDPAAGECRDLPQPADTVSLDPAWSPNGSQVAFVRADGWKVEGTIGSEKGPTWVDSRRLWVARADGSDAHEITSAGTGIYAPAWTKDGRRLVYIKEGALWVLDLQAGVPGRVVSLGTSSFPRDLWYRSWPYSVAYHQP